MATTGTGQESLWDSSFAKFPPSEDPCATIFLFLVRVCSFLSLLHIADESERDRLAGTFALRDAHRPWLRTHFHGNNCWSKEPFFRKSMQTNSISDAARTKSMLMTLIFVYSCNELHCRVRAVTMAASWLNAIFRNTRTWSNFLKCIIYHHSNK